MEIKFDPASTPESIEKRSFEIIDSEIPEPRPWKGRLWQIARRCIHALGDCSIVQDLEFQENAVSSGLTALKNRCRIYTDTSMLAAGLVERRMKPLGIEVIPLMKLPEIEELAKLKKVTRSAAAVQLVAKKLDGQIIAIGNAPTALITLLQELDALKAEGIPVAPALIVGMPVGFVNAAQSKLLLRKSGWPYFTLHGRRGGSAVAAAAINALAEIALQEKKTF